MQLGKQRGEKQKLGHVPKTHTCTSYTQSDRKGNDAWSCVSFPWTVLSWTEWEGRAVQRERKRENRGRRGEKEQTYLFISLWARDQVFISLLLHYSRVNDMGNHGKCSQNVLCLPEITWPRLCSQTDCPKRTETCSVDYCYNQWWDCSLCSGNMLSRGQLGQDNTDPLAPIPLYSLASLISPSHMPSPLVYLSIHGSPQLPSNRVTILWLECKFIENASPIN